LPIVTIDRPRPRDRVTALLQTHGAALVVGPAGSGKTTLAQQVMTHHAGTAELLTLDDAHRDPDQLADGLLGVRGRTVPTEDLSTVEQQPPLQPTIDERVASIASELEGRELLVVIDNCEQIADATVALSALGTFVRYLPNDAKVLLLSREDLSGPFSRMLLHGEVGRFSAEDLELDADETDRLLGALGVVAPSPQLVTDVAGWAAAAPFLVDPDGVQGFTACSLAEYLSVEVLGRRSEEERTLLLRTSVVATVTQRAVTALCGPDAVAVFDGFRTHYLPARIGSDSSMIYQPLLRQHLRECLEAERLDEVDALRRRAAELMIDLGRHEVAVDEFLDLGDLERAADAAERAIVELNERAEWVTIQTWLDRIGWDVFSSRPRLLGAYIRSLYGLREFARARALVRRLTLENLMGEIVTVDPGVVPYLGLVYHWRPLDALDLINQHEGDFRADVLRYELEVLSGNTPVTPPTGVDWSDMERIMSFGLLMQGRLDQLLLMLPSDSDWTSPSFYRTPHPLLGLVWCGELERARDLIGRVPDEVRSRSHTDLWHFQEAWLLWAENDLQGMLVAAEAAIEHSRATGFGAESCFQVVRAVALLGLERRQEAERVLEESITRSREAGLTAYVEWAKTFLGLVLLADDRDERAAEVLRDALEGMLASDRRLMLPLTGVYLSEAAWRIGDTAASRDAADVALREAERAGSMFVLCRALRHVPAVLDRQFGDDPASRWREPLRARADEQERSPIVADDRSDSVVFLEIRTFGGDAGILVDGRPVGARRVKVLELATLLALHPNGIERELLQRRLFPDADPRRSGNYFRQVVHKLRKITGISLSRTNDGLVRWPECVHVETTDGRVEELVSRAQASEGPERLSMLVEALDLMTGPFLCESDLEWAEQRRNEIDVLRSEFGREAAELALHCGENDIARNLASAVIAEDPFCEAAYRVLMSAEAHTSQTAALSVFQRLCVALEKIGVEPTQETKELLRRIRN